ncbi:Crp/Fnr family transcriptional regulator [Glacieibacterium sp.]|uniref:Crp/Fnr family transcriptional regulator n=1 Tax=Glacieibacterium sp. TaxID=2860237 RepID=UPI003AFFD082
MTTSDDGTNRLLSLMATQDSAALAARGEVVALVKGSDLARAGDVIDYCWFPLSGLASIIAADGDGNEAEVGVVGHDGMVNSSVLTGSRRSPMRVLVQLGGSALRIDARMVLALTGKSPDSLSLLMAFHQSLTIQASYSALAYARYPIIKRLARWMLMCANRVGEDHIDLTHDALSIMLGVRRAGVTVALRALEQEGAVGRRRGDLSIVNRPILLAIAGAGYGGAETEYRRLLAAHQQSSSAR